MVEAGQPGATMGEVDAELDHLLSQVDKTQKRTIWLLHGCLRIDYLAAVLKSVSPCSRVVNMIWHDQAVFSRTADSKMTASVLNDERLRIVTKDEPESQARLVSTLFDVNSFLGWKPVLGQRVPPEGVTHLQLFYQSFKEHLNRKAVSRITQIHSSFTGTQLGTDFPSLSFVPYCLYPFQQGDSSFKFLNIVPILPSHSPIRLPSVDMQLHMWWSPSNLQF